MYKIKYIEISRKSVILKFTDKNIRKSKSPIEVLLHNAKSNKIYIITSTISK